MSIVENKEAGPIIEIRAWEPVPGHATIKVGNNGTYRGEIIFSNTGGFGSGVELLDDPEVSFALAQELTKKILGVEEEQLAKTLKDANEDRAEEIKCRLGELREPRRRALYRNALVHLGVDLVERR